jgi:hypothetical protein
MTSRTRIDFVLILGAVLWSLQACGQRIEMDGSTPGLPDGEKPAEEPAIEDVLEDSGFHMHELPSLYPATYDFSLPSEENAEIESGNGGSPYGLTRTRGLEQPDVESTPPPVGTLSRAGCEADVVKWHLFGDGAEMDTFLCYIDRVQVADPAAIIPKNKWAYYQIKIPMETDEGLSTMRIRVGRFDSEFRMDACELGDEGPVRVLEMRLAMESTKINGYVTRAENETLDGVQSAGSCKLDVSMIKNNDGTVAHVRYVDHDRTKSENGDSTHLEAAFESEAATKMNTAYAEFRKQIAGWGTYDLNVWGQWGDQGYGSVQMKLASETKPPTAAECRAFGVSEEELDSCEGRCFYNGEGEGVPPNSKGNCTIDLKRTESFDINDPPFTPQFSMQQADSNPHYEGAKAKSLPSLIDEAGDPEVFSAEWDCQNSRGFRALDTDGKAKMDTCGTTNRLPTLKSCDAQVWAQRNLARRAGSF